MCSNEMLGAPPVWELNDLVATMDTSFTLLSSRNSGMNPFMPCCFRGSYKPWVTDLRRPEHLVGYISESDWIEKITKFNESLRVWWEPGAFWRDCLNSAQMYTCCLTSLCADYFDEDGGECIASTVNKRKKDAIEVLSPICNQLSDTNLIWSVGWDDPFSRLYPDDPKIAKEFNDTREYNLSIGKRVIKQLELTVKLRHPISPFIRPPSRPKKTNPE